jgi:hypothetical protein
MHPFLTYLRYASRPVPLFPHADWIEWAQVIVSLAATVYAWRVYRIAKADHDLWEPANGTLFKWAEAAKERCLRTFHAQAFLLIGGTFCIFMEPTTPFDFSQQGFWFRFFVILSTIATALKSRREIFNRTKIFEYMDRRDKRAEDRYDRRRGDTVPDTPAGPSGALS